MLAAAAVEGSFKTAFEMSQPVNLGANELGLPNPPWDHGRGVAPTRELASSTAAEKGARESIVICDEREKDCGIRNLGKLN
jgi:hypothetical protein